ncbi:MAG: hypothetical protein IT424_15635, partial [Pirellulales bacterium]|nr:hypothetical protein [Pirellulales bacterium]
APFTAPAGLKRNILSREQELNAYLDEVAQNYQNPPPAAASAPAAVTPGPAPKSAPNNTDSAPRQTLPPPAARRRPPAASPSPQAYYLSRLADRLRSHLAQANNGRAQRGPNNAPSNQLPAAAPQPPAPTAVLSPKTELPLQAVNGRQTAWLGSPDNWERSSE